MRGVFVLSSLLTAGVLIACQPEAQTSAPNVSAPAELVIKHADANQAADILAASKDVVVLDIRTPGEVSKGHIPGAQMADFKSPNFVQDISKLDRNAAYVVHCASGGRSTKSLDIFKKLGFTNVTHLDGGFRAWQTAGLPVTPAQ